MGYANGAPLIWPGEPDWSQPVIESLVFATDVMQASAGAQAVRSLRDAPRRAFALQQTFDRDAAQLADAVIAATGMQPLWLPIYPDGLVLTNAIDAGATSVFLDTTGRDFAAGSSVLFYRGVDDWELATVDTVDADHLVLTGPTQHDWGVGTRLYPARRARLTDAAKETFGNDTVITVASTLEVDDVCTWPAAWPTSTVYRTQPVLEWRNEESDDPTGEYDRLSNAIDNTVAAPYIVDVPGMPFRAQSQRFLMHGRAAHLAFRSLLYALNGRENVCWVPSWLADARLTAPAAAGDASLTIANVGYAATGGPRMNRQDVMIELIDGTRLYRRVTDASASGDTETLTLDSAPGVALSSANVRVVSWLRLCALASDTVQIQHETDADGVGNATLGWQAVQHDL